MYQRTGKERLVRCLQGHRQLFPARYAVRVLFIDDIQVPQTLKLFCHVQKSTIDDELVVQQEVETLGYDKCARVMEEGRICA